MLKPPKIFGFILLCLGLFCLAGSAPAADTGRPQPDKPLSLSLPEAILLAVRDNTDIKNAYLDRVLQKFNLKVAEHKFKPSLDLSGNISRYRSNTKTTQSGTTTEDSDNIYDQGSLAATVTQNVPTGAQFTFTWEHDEFRDTSDQFYSRSSGNTWGITMNQPLLQGAGIDANMASVRQARIAEQQNILNLKSTLINTITNVITLYRSFVQAADQVTIAKQSLARAKQLLDQNKIMIAAGRMARSDLVQSLSNVANQRIAYQQAINSQEQARLSLLKVLNMDKNLRIVPKDSYRPPKRHPGWQESLQLAYHNQPAYLQAKLQVQNSKQDVIVAENQQLWGLNLQVGYNYSDADQNLDVDTRQWDWNAGLFLSIPLYGTTKLSQEQQLVQARTGLLKDQNNLEQAEENMKIDIDNALRDLKIKREQVELAIQALRFAKEKLANEQEKLKYGKSSNFQVVTYQTDLSQAESGLLGAKIDYLNALVALDQILGTTLDTWRIEFRTERRQSERLVRQD